VWQDKLTAGHATLPSGDDLARALNQIVERGGAIREVSRAGLELEELFTRIICA